MKTVLFDLDGTLINSALGITTSTRYALRAFGIEEPDLDNLRCFIGPPLADSFQRYYDFSPEKARQAVEKYRERYNVKGIFECELYQDVETVLKRLRESGYRIAMASSKPEVSCKRILEHFEIADYFDEITGATLDGSRDSKLEVLQEVVRRLSISCMEDALLVGDTCFDVQGAKEAGMKCLGVSYGFGTREDLLENGAIAVCGSMKEVGDYIAARF